MLARLVSGNYDLQKVACDAGAIPRLTALLKTEHHLSAKLMESTMDALAALTERWEHSRHLLVEANVSPHAPCVAPSALLACIPAGPFRDVIQDV